MQRMDTFLMSLQAIRANKLRSSLTLVGIVLGVASIIAVMTGISVVQGTMEKEMSVLGAQTFQVQKWPAGFSSDEERRKAMRRPAVTLDDAQAIRDHVDTVDIVGAEIWDFGFKAEYRGQETNENLWICGGTPEYPQTTLISFATVAIFHRWMCMPVAGWPSSATVSHRSCILSSTLSVAKSA